MKSIEVVPKRINLADEYGEVPFGAHDGQDLSHRIGSYDKNIVVLLDCEKIIGIGASFLRTAFGGLNRTIGNVRDPMVAMINTGNEDIEWTIDMALPILPVDGIVIGNDSRVSMLSRKPHLLETFEVAKKLSIEQDIFTSPELAEELDLTLPNINARLASLLHAGSVTRRRDTKNSRGKRYVYRSVIDADIS